MISRRHFLAVSGLVASGRIATLGAPRSFPQQPNGSYFAWESIADGLRIARGGGGASLVVSDAGESLLVDCKSYGLGATLRREIESDGNRLAAVIDTHHHSAQTGGNPAFTADVPLFAHRRAGPRIVSAVEGVLEALQQDPEGGIIKRRRQQILEGAYSEDGARQALRDFDAYVANVDRIIPGNFGPTATFDESYELQVGGLAVQLHHFGNAHTDNDIVVWIPERNVAHVGNLVYIETHPVIDAPRGGNIADWKRSLNRIRELCGPEAIIVPADGGLLASARDVEVQDEYFDAISALAQSAIDAGMSRQEAVDFIPSTRMGRFSGLEQPGRLAANLGIAYDELVR